MTIVRRYREAEGAHDNLCSAILAVERWPDVEDLIVDVGTRPPPDVYDELALSTGVHWTWGRSASTAMTLHVVLPASLAEIGTRRIHIITLAARLPDGNPCVATGEIVHELAHAFLGHLFGSTDDDLESAACAEAVRWGFGAETVAMLKDTSKGSTGTWDSCLDRIDEPRALAAAAQEE
jgi:hypothetical protein